MNGNEKGMATSMDKMTACLEVWRLAGFTLAGGLDVKLLCVFLPKAGWYRLGCLQTDVRPSSSSPYLYLLQSWVMKLERVVLKLDLRATIGELVVVGIPYVLVLKIELRHVYPAF